MQKDISQTSRLLSQWIEGDERALEKILQRHLSWLHGQVRMRMGPNLRKKAETQDFVQESLIQFLRYGPRFHITNEEHLRALLRRIVENTLHDGYDRFTARRRSMSRERPLPADTVLYLDPPKESAGNPCQYAQRHEQEAWIRLCIELLEPEDRDIIVMRQWDSLSFVEIGREMGLSPNAAWMRHNRAVDRLSEIVGKMRKGDWTDL
ncbi:MAG: RNA polymerase sigma factor [Planctomycetes bacterium]|nr:RNA polymerase sigma factor [Planctomycetota bacterium]